MSPKNGVKLITPKSLEGTPLDGWRGTPLCYYLLIVNKTKDL